MMPRGHSASGGAKAVAALAMMAVLSSCGGGAGVSDSGDSGGGYAIESIEFVPAKLCDSDFEVHNANVFQGSCPGVFFHLTNPPPYMLAKVRAETGDESLQGYVAGSVCSNPGPLDGLNTYFNVAFALGKEGLLECKSDDMHGGADKFKLDVVSENDAEQQWKVSGFCPSSAKQYAVTVKKGTYQCKPAYMIDRGSLSEFTE